MASFEEFNETYKPLIQSLSIEELIWIRLMSRHEQNLRKNSTAQEPEESVPNQLLGFLEEKRPMLESMNDRELSWLAWAAHYQTRINKQEQAAQESK